MRLKLLKSVAFVLLLFATVYPLFGMELSTEVLIQNKKPFDSELIISTLAEFDNHECFGHVKRFPVIFGSQQKIQTSQTNQILKKTIYFSQMVKEIDSIEELFLNDSYGQAIKSQCLEEIKTEYKTFLDSTAKTINSVDPLLRYWISITKQPKDRLLDTNKFFDDFTVKHQLFTLSDFQTLQASFPKFERQHVLVEKNSLLISHVFPWLQEHGLRLIEWHKLNTEGSPLLHQIWNSCPCFIEKKDEYQETSLYSAVFARDLKEHRELYGIDSGPLLDFDKDNNEKDIKDFFEKIAFNIQEKESILDTFFSRCDNAFSIRGWTTNTTELKYWGSCFARKMVKAAKMHDHIENFFSPKNDFWRFLPTQQELLKNASIFPKTFEKFLPKIRTLNGLLEKHFMFSLNEGCIFFDLCLRNKIKQELFWAQMHLLSEQQTISMSSINRLKTYEEYLVFLKNDKVNELMAYQKNFLKELRDQKSIIQKIYPKLSDFLLKLQTSLQTTYSKINGDEHQYFLAISKLLMLKVDSFVRKIPIEDQIMNNLIYNISQIPLIMIYRDGRCEKYSSIEQNNKLLTTKKNLFLSLFKIMRPFCFQRLLKSGCVYTQLHYIATMMMLKFMKYFSYWKI
ncbi:hypothetical protein IPH25_00365 [bacterium]|nr:MAG: hypothetical protein IPG37_02480 [bacterium]QQR61887.1 MAG: hypothetical protein IPH25_00365 [bacterium]QQR62528.1 MAG: hypothetical protein IPH67_03850 [bacterium]